MLDITQNIYLDLHVEYSEIVNEFNFFFYFDC
jgi:hypothetical protein